MEVHIYVIFKAPVTTAQSLNLDSFHVYQTVFYFFNVIIKHYFYYLFAFFCSIILNCFLMIVMFSNCILKPFNAETYMIIKYSNTEQKTTTKKLITLTVFYYLFVGWETLDRVKRYVDPRAPFHVHVVAPAPWMEGFPPFPSPSLPGHPILPLVSCPRGALSKWLVSTSTRGTVLHLWKQTP